jgi:hypothetical protein
VNRVKVAVMQNLGEAANLKAERKFVGRALAQGTARGIRELLAGDPAGLLRTCAMAFGLALAGSGYAVGLVQAWVSGRVPRYRFRPR